MNEDNQQSLTHPEYFTPLHHEVAALLGYAQTPGYATWDKAEDTAPVQVIDRVTDFLSGRIALAQQEERKRIYSLMPSSDDIFAACERKDVDYLYGVIETVDTEIAWRMGEHSDAVSTTPTTQKGEKQ